MLLGEPEKEGIVSFGADGVEDGGNVTEWGQGGSTIVGNAWNWLWQAEIVREQDQDEAKNYHLCRRRTDNNNRQHCFRVRMTRFKGKSFFKSWGVVKLQINAS